MVNVARLAVRFETHGWNLRCVCVFSIVDWFLSMFASNSTCTFFACRIWNAPHRRRPRHFRLQNSRLEWCVCAWWHFPWEPMRTELRCDSQHQQKPSDRMMGWHRSNRTTATWKTAIDRLLTILWCDVEMCAAPVSKGCKKTRTRRMVTGTIEWDKKEHAAVMYKTATIKRASHAKNERRKKEKKTRMLNKREELLLRQ